MAAEHEPRFDPIASARELYLLHSMAIVLAREIFRRDPCGFDDARVEYELFCGARAGGVRIRN